MLTWLIIVLVILFIAQIALDSWSSDEQKENDFSVINGVGNIQNGQYLNNFLTNINERVIACQKVLQDDSVTNVIFETNVKIKMANNAIDKLNQLIQDLKNKVYILDEKCSGFVNYVGDIEGKLEKLEKLPENMITKSEYKEMSSILKELKSSNDLIYNKVFVNGNIDDDLTNNSIEKSLYEKVIETNTDKNIFKENFLGTSTNNQNKQIENVKNINNNTSIKDNIKKKAEEINRNIENISTENVETKEDDNNKNNISEIKQENIVQEEKVVPVQEQNVVVEESRGIADDVDTEIEDNPINDIKEDTKKNEVEDIKNEEVQNNINDDVSVSVANDIEEKKEGVVNSTQDINNSEVKEENNTDNITQNQDIEINNEKKEDIDNTKAIVDNNLDINVSNTENNDKNEINDTLDLDLNDSDIEFDLDVDLSELKNAQIVDDKPDKIDAKNEENSSVVGESIKIDGEEIDLNPKFSEPEMIKVEDVVNRNDGGINMEDFLNDTTSSHDTTLNTSEIKGKVDELKEKLNIKNPEE